jgi:hypothetical protein
MLDPDFSQSSFHANEKANQFSHLHISQPNRISYLIFRNVKLHVQAVTAYAFLHYLQRLKIPTHPCIVGKLPNVSLLFSFCKADALVRRQKRKPVCDTCIICCMYMTSVRYSLHNGLPFLLCCILHCHFHVPCNYEIIKSHI